MREIIRFVLLLLPLIGLTVQADGLKSSVSYQGEWLFIEQTHGLVVNLPAEGTPDLLSQLNKLRTELSSHQEEYIKAVEKTRFKTSDAIIALLMPGGLVYAASKKQQHANAKENLNLVRAQLGSVRGDLDFFQLSYSRELLASR